MTADRFDEGRTGRKPPRSGGEGGGRIEDLRSGGDLPAFDPAPLGARERCQPGADAPPMPFPENIYLGASPDDRV